VAVKTLEKKGLSDAQLSKLLMEVDIYLKMDHVNIAKLFRVFNEEDKVYLVMEYCSQGDLNDFIVREGDPGLPESRVRRIVAEILLALLHLLLSPASMQLLLS